MSGILGRLLRRGSVEKLPPPAAPPTYPRALRTPIEGTYRGTVRVSDERQVRAHGMGGSGRVKLVLASEGLVLERRGTNDMLIEQDELTGASRSDGSLVVTWRHGAVPLRTTVELGEDVDIDGWVESLEQMGKRT